MSKNVRLILLFSLLGLLAGVIKSYQEPMFQVYRLFLIHDNDNKNATVNNSVWFKDNVMRLKSNVIARTYSKSNPNVKINTDGRLSEMKIYIPESFSKTEVFNSLKAELDLTGASIYKSQYQYNTINRSSIFHYLITGLFLGLLTNFFRDLRKS